MTAIRATCGALFLMLLVGCSSAGDIEERLLTPEELAGGFDLLSKETVELGGGEQSAEAVLTSAEYTVYHAVVTMGTEKRAREALARLKGSQDTLGEKVADAPPIGNEVLGVFKDLSSRNRTYLVFTEGSYFVRVTLEGDAGAQELVEISEKAWEKVR